MHLTRQFSMGNLLAVGTDKGKILISEFRHSLRALEVFVYCSKAELQEDCSRRNDKLDNYAVVFDLVGHLTREQL